MRPPSSRFVRRGSSVAIKLGSSRAIALRCAFCHGPVAAVPPCPGCGTFVHADCMRETRICPTLGCDHATTSEPATKPRSHRRWRNFIWLGVAAAFVFLLTIANPRYAIWALAAGLLSAVMLLVREVLVPQAARRVVDCEVEQY